MLNFFDTATENMLIIEVNPGGVLIPYDFVQLNFKVKYCYFLRREAVKITGENCGSVLVAGEMTPRTFDELAAVVEDVCVRDIRRLFADACV